LKLIEPGSIALGSQKKKKGQEDMNIEAILSIDEPQLKEPVFDEALAGLASEKWRVPREQ
jgi:hypothetical protein